MENSPHRRLPNLDRESILWWLEFQERGAPHVHFLYTTRVPWEAAASQWARAVGDESIERTATRYEKVKQTAAMASYVGKYASKMEQKEVPEAYRKVGRFWGIRGCRSVREAAMMAKTSESAEKLQHALAVAAEAEVSRGTCQVKLWKYGQGMTIIKRKGSQNLEQTGALARIETALSQSAINCELTFCDDYLLD